MPTALIDRTAKRDELTSAIRRGELDAYKERRDEDYEHVVLSLVCQHCGHVGLKFRGFSIAKPFSFRAFHICPECGDEREF